MKLTDLDCKQKEVVEAVVSCDERVLALGGPGTGKTTTALWTARTFLDTSIQALTTRVLFLTFSRAAVGQVMSRSPGVLSAVSSRVDILTFHALAYRLLRAFGRYAGYGTAPPSVQSETHIKLFGHDRAHLSYDDLLTGATRLLQVSQAVSRLVGTRWGLVICDEVQDTNRKQWEFLQLIAAAKLLLLGDVNQMIYTFIPGVSPEWFQWIRQWADREITLLPRSHRDPSGAIPALAEAVRVRDFRSAAVAEALRTDRLTIHFDTNVYSHSDVVVSEIRKAQKLGSENVGVFVHSNEAVAEMAEVLNDAGVDHALIGIPEAHAEALGAMAMQCGFAVGLTEDQQVRQALALFLTASGRRRQVPLIAQALIGRGTLPGLVENAIQSLERALSAAAGGTLQELAEVAAGSWGRLAIAGGRRSWQRASRHFRRLVAPLFNERVSQESVRAVLRIVERSRVEALVDRDYSERGRVKLMNYHQTKGREADTVIHVFRSEDYFGQEVEPFEKTSRLLNVAISRARRRVVVILPPDPHPLVAPFRELRDAQRPSVLMS